MKAVKFLIVLLLPFFVQAQDAIKIESVKYSGFGNGEVSAFKVEAPRVTRANFMKHWEKYLKSSGEIDPVVTETDITVKKVVLKPVTAKPLNVYMHFEDMEGGTRVFVGVEDSIDGFIGRNHNENGIALEKLIADETTKVFIDAKENDLDKEEDLLKTLDKDLKGLIKDKENIGKKVAKNEREIEKLKQENEFNTGQLETLQKMVSDKQLKYKTLPKSTSKEEKKEAKSELKVVEKEYDKTVSGIDKATEKIFDLEAENREYQQQLEGLATQINEATTKVETQTEIVQTLKNEVFELENK